MSKDVYTVLEINISDLGKCRFCGSALNMISRTTEYRTDYAIQCSLAFRNDTPDGDDCPLSHDVESFWCARKIEAIRYYERWTEFFNRNSKS